MNINIIDYQRSPNELNLLKSVDIIIFIGGNTFLAMKEARKVNFKKKLLEALNSGVMLASESAANLLLSPSIELAENNFMSDENIVGLKDYSGFNIINFAVFPHYLDEFKTKLTKLKKDKNINYPIYAIKDGQSVVFKDGKLSFINGEPIIF